jgi:hypothetical protein
MPVEDVAGFEEGHDRSRVDGWRRLTPCRRRHDGRSEPRLEEVFLDVVDRDSATRDGDGYRCGRRFSRSSCDRGRDNDGIVNASFSWIVRPFARRDLVVVENESVMVGGSLMLLYGVLKFREAQSARCSVAHRGETRQRLTVHFEHGATMWSEVEGNGAKSVSVGIANLGKEKARTPDSHPMIRPQPWQAIDDVKQSHVRSTCSSSTVSSGHEVSALHGGASVEKRTI